MKLIARIVKGLPAPWAWAVFVFLAFTLVPVVSEAMRFYELRRFFDLSVATGFYTLVVIVSAVFIGIGVYWWRMDARLKLEASLRIRELEMVAREKDKKIEELETEIAEKDNIARELETVLRGQDQEISEGERRIQELGTVVSEKEQRIQDLEKWEPPIIENFGELESGAHIPVIERLFRRYRKVILRKRFTGGYQNSGVFQVGVEEPRDDSPIPVDRVLKFADARDIKAEAKQYVRCVRQRLPRIGGEPIEHLYDSEPGAAIYELARLSEQSELLNFGEFYSRNQAADVRRIVRRLYDDDHLGRLHKPQNRLARNDLKVYGEYDRLIRKLDKIERHVRDLGRVLNLEWLHHIDRNDGPQVEADLPGIGTYDLRNPLYWVDNTFRSRERRGATEPGCEGIVHGDFHSGNVLIEDLYDAGHFIWLIDFAHTREQGHTLDDFCRLEADIKFYLTRVTEAVFPAVWKFEKALLKPRQAHQLDLSALSCPTEPRQLNKAWDCIKTIRNLGVPHLAGTNVYPYFLSLLHSTLPVVYYQQCDPWQKLHAFVSAALLCEQMDELHEVQ